MSYSPKLFITNLHRYTENVFGVCTDFSLFANSFLADSFYLPVRFAKISPCQIFPIYGMILWLIGATIMHETIRIGPIITTFVHNPVQLQYRIAGIYFNFTKLAILNIFGSIISSMYLLLWINHEYF